MKKEMANSYKGNIEDITSQNMNLLESTLKELKGKKKDFKEVKISVQSLETNQKELINILEKL